MTSVDSVFLMKKDGTLQIIGKIDSNTKKTYNLIKHNLNIINFNNKILYYIAHNFTIATDPHIDHKIVVGDITGIIYKIVRWRRCTGFLVLQISNKGIRLLCYLYDKIIHFANSFGTGILNVSKQYLSNNIKEELENKKILQKEIINYLVKNNFGI